MTHDLQEAPYARKQTVEGKLEQGEALPSKMTARGGQQCHSPTHTPAPTEKSVYESCTLESDTALMADSQTAIL